MTILPAILQPVNLYRPVFTLYAGKSNSYSGSGQTWYNTTSSPADGSAKSAYDFYLGNTSGSDSEDPTFNGTAGNQSSSEYFNFDGADDFTIAGGNTTFTNSLHKDNAVFTFATLIYLGSLTTQSILGTTGGTGNGITLRANASGNITFTQSDGTTAHTIKTAAGIVSATTPLMVAISYTESTGVGLIYVNTGTKTTSTISTSYTTPSSSAANTALTIAGEAPGDTELSSGSKMWFAGMWNTALSETQLDTIFNRTRRLAGI